MWNNRATKGVKNNVPKELRLSTGIPNVLFLESQKVLFPTLFIKSNVFKNCVKATDKESGDFKHLKPFCSKLRDEKLREGIIEPETRKIIKDFLFKEKHNGKKLCLGIVL